MLPDACVTFSSHAPSPAVHVCRSSAGVCWLTMARHRHGATLRRQTSKHALKTQHALREASTQQLRVGVIHCRGNIDRGRHTTTIRYSSSPPRKHTASAALLFAKRLQAAKQALFFTRRERRCGKHTPYAFCAAVSPPLLAALPRACAAVTMPNAILRDVGNITTVETTPLLPAVAL